ncbi:hypothetical protein [Streptomyces sp. NPDC020983]|uniref:hypothetical protein n=1 Tax=Streptomyces sp. NPDC020983 TaxID=3365106 RepID=UPI0037B12915
MDLRRPWEKPTTSGRLKTSTPENRPAGGKQRMNPWDRFHDVRVAVIVAVCAPWAAALA